MINAVLFDLDNTLVDFRVMKDRASEAAIRAMIDSGLKLNQKDATKLLFELYDKHGIENQLIFNKFIKHVTGKVDYKMLANAIVAYRRMKQTSTEPFPHVRNTLIKLKEHGLKLGIVSDAPRMNAWLRLAEMNLTDFFSVVITLGDSKKLKPFPNSFKKALRALNMEPSEVLFVGDNPDRDVKGAKALGMKSCLARYGQVFVNETIKADYEINNIEELVKIIEKENSN